MGRGHDGGVTSQAATPATPHAKFIEWLKNNMLHSYQQALEEEGYEELESLTLLSEKEIDELSTSIKMKPGHRKKLPVAIKRAREEMQEREQERKREKAKQQREEEGLEELGKIEMERKLAKARSSKDAEEQNKETENASFIFFVFVSSVFFLN